MKGLNGTGTTTHSSVTISSVSHYTCPHSANFSREVNSAILSWSLVVIASIASLLAVITNVLVIIVIKRTKHLQSRSNFLLANLAVADILMGAVCMPFFAAAELLMLHQASFEYICIVDSVRIRLTIFLTFSSLCHLTFIAWERYVAVRKWKSYKAIVTKGRVRMLAIIGWLVATVYFIIILAIGINKTTVNKLFITTAVLVAFCSIAIVFFYAMVYLELRKRNLTDITQTTSRRKNFESKVAKTSCLVTVALVVSFVPGIMIAIFLQLFPALRRSSLFRVPGFLFTLNSLLNPLIYFYTNQRFRNALLNLLKVRKSLAIHQSEHFRRRKDLSASFECVDMQIGERDIGLPRSGSFDAAQVSELVHPWSHEINLKRFMSAPSGPERISYLEGSPRNQHFSTLTTTASIHVESWQCQIERNYSKRRGAFLEALQTTNKQIHLGRPASCDPAINQLDCGNREPHKKMLNRSLSMPSLGKSNNMFKCFAKPLVHAERITTATRKEKNIGRCGMTESYPSLQKKDIHQRSTSFTCKSPRSKSLEHANCVI